MIPAELMTWLRQHGQRLTPQRLHILGAVHHAVDCLTAEEVFALVQPAMPTVDIATVYRTLNWLHQIGLVAPIEGIDGRMRYEYHGDGALHHHLVCRQCGTMLRIDPEVSAELATALIRQHAFHLDHHLALPGRCESCAGRPDAP
jgi:Fur family ferric uptake transcriptional regulator